MGFLATCWPERYLLSALAHLARFSEVDRLAFIDAIEFFRVSALNLESSSLSI